MKKVYEHHVTYDFDKSLILDQFDNCQWSIKEVTHEDGKKRKNNLYELFISNGKETLQVIKADMSKGFFHPDQTSFPIEHIEEIMSKTEQKNPSKIFTKHIDMLSEMKHPVRDYIQKEIEEDTDILSNSLGKVNKTIKDTFNKFYKSDSKKKTI